MWICHIQVVSTFIINKQKLINRLGYVAILYLFLRKSVLLLTELICYTYSVVIEYIT